MSEFGIIVFFTKVVKYICFWTYQNFLIAQVEESLCQNIGADFTGATGNFAPVLTQEPGQTLRFAAVSFMAVL